MTAEPEDDGWTEMSSAGLERVVDTALREKAMQFAVAIFSHLPSGTALTESAEEIYAFLKGDTE